MAAFSSADVMLLEALLPAPLLAALRQLDSPAAALADAYAQLEATLAALIPYRACTRR